MPLIIADAVHKSFGSIHVLKGVSLSIEKGEVVSIIGKSGSGKTTFLRCMNALESIDKGTITVLDGQGATTTAELRKLRLKVGMIFQQFNLFPHINAGQNVMLAQMVVKKTPKEEARQIALKMLDRVGLTEKFDAYPRALSGGQQQRVAIARALAMQPVALLCDEITSALDPELVNEVLAVVRELAEDGMTLVMVTHEMRFAREVSSRVVFMHQGQVHESGPPSEIFTKPRTSELKQFLGLHHSVA